MLEKKRLAEVPRSGHPNQSNNIITKKQDCDTLA